MWGSRRRRGDRIEVIRNDTRPVCGRTRAQWAQNDEDAERMARDLPLRNPYTGVLRDDWNHNDNDDFVEALIVSLKAAGASAAELAAARREAREPWVREVPKTGTR
jgi:hypothetical protein